MKTVPAASRTSIVASLLPLALAGALLIPPDAGAGEETGKAILAPFQEEIFTVQEAKCRPVKPAAGVLSIPYTRLNVAVIDGIAFFRLVQIYHNHSDVNQGYAFTLPISPDTTITQFNLWDRGTRYAGSIEERPKAEAAYKETTGEEAPEMPMPRDPGLVRVGWNSYEMRVFPIFPGENKQIELFWHERLPMKNGEFFLNFPLRRLVASSDPRHPDAKSLLTEVTVSVQDDLPLVSFSSQSLPLKETAVGDRFRLLGGTFDTPETTDLSLRWVLKFPPEPSCRSMTFSAEGKNYFLTRVLVRMPEKGPQPLPAASPRAYYIGVWRDQSGGEIGENKMLESLGLELAAYSTGLILDPRDRFHCAWVPSNFPSAPGTAMTERLYRSDDKDREAVLRKLLGGPKKEPGVMKDLPDSIFSHLKDAVQKDGCRLVYIFCDPLTPASVQRLSAIVDANPSTNFFLITEGGKLPDVLGRKNVFHYALREGWRRDEGLSSRDETFFFLDNERGTFSSLFFGAHNYLSLDLLWRRLPNLTPAVPMIAARGD
ncbi:MAG: VIT domain-containing protein, partial [Candidatus Aureabacteria bacterium]|nr:VIT domain-containing protein [Candidatus Auribacterota bacterium]